MGAWRWHGDAPTEAEYKAAGIKHIYLKSTACAAARKNPVTDLSAVEDDITPRRVTGTGAKAEQLVAAMKQKVDAVRTGSRHAASSGPRTSSSTTTPAQAASVVCNASRQRGDHAGGARNVFATATATTSRSLETSSPEPGLDPAGVRNRRRGGEQEGVRRARMAGEQCGDQGLTAVKEHHFLRIGSEQTTIAGSPTPTRSRRSPRPSTPARSIAVFTAQSRPGQNATQAGRTATLPAGPTAIGLA